MQKEPQVTRARCDELSASIMLSLVTTSKSSAVSSSGIADGMCKEFRLQMLTDPRRSAQAFQHSLEQLPWPAVWRCAHAAVWGAVVLPLLIDATKIALLIDATKIAHALRHFQKHGVALPVEVQQKPRVRNFQHKKHSCSTFKIGASCALLAMVFFIGFFALHRCLSGRNASGRRVQKLQKVAEPVENDDWTALPRKGESAEFFRMFTGADASMGSSDALDRQLTA